MHDFNSQYFFLRPEEDERLPILTPDANTEDRRFGYLPQPVGSPPLVFVNGSRDYDIKLGIRGLAEPPGILFCGTDLVVKTSIRDALLRIDIPNLHMHPAVYIHDDGKWYEDYWFLTFLERFDCWDRTLSDFEDEPLELGGHKLYSVYTYRLNSGLLDNTALNHRLLFKMGGTQDPYIVCHDSIAGIFRTRDANGVRLVSIADY